MPQHPSAALPDPDTETEPLIITGRRAGKEWGVRDWLTELNLEPHPEGGYFRRVYTHADTVSLPHGQRPLATSIHYLLTREQPLGRLHRNRSDILHFLVDGGPVEYVLLGADGELRRVRLGEPDERFLAVPGGCWKASHLVDGCSHALVSEVVVPGFDYADHEFATGDDEAGFGPHLETLRPFLPGR